nr:peptidase S8 [Pseudomonadota bacterium]
MKKNHIAAAIVLSLGLSSAAFAGGRPDLVLSGLQAGRAHVPGELLVKYRDGTTDTQQAAARNSQGAHKVRTVRNGNARNGE